MGQSALTRSLVRRLGSGLAATYLHVQPEISPSDTEHLYHMFNDGSVEVETAEFLYGLVRLMKPKLVLETGTHKGISSAYMAEGCKDNERGIVISLEWDTNYRHWAQQLHEILGLALTSRPYVTVIQANTTTWDIHELDPIMTPPEIDILLLDSEPNIRYAEFVRYWPFVKPGGIIMIHDLHPNMSYSPGVVNPDHPELGEFWPFGDFRDTGLGKEIKEGRLQYTNFRTPRGFALYYKVAYTEDTAYKWSAGELPLDRINRRSST